MTRVNTFNKPDQAPGAASGEFTGYHSEWSLDSPGGWAMQGIAQDIGKSVWQNLVQERLPGLALDFDHPLFHPVDGLVGVLASAHCSLSGSDRGLIAIVAGQDTIMNMVDNPVLVSRVNRSTGLACASVYASDLEVCGGRVCWRDQAVSVIYLDMSTGRLLQLHREHSLEPLLQAVREGRVVNPRGLEPLNSKGVFEVITDPGRRRHFHDSTVRHTPWTRMFYERRTTGPDGQEVADLAAWARSNWQRLVLKPARGHTGRGVFIGGLHPDADGCIGRALTTGEYVVQEKVPLDNWAEPLPVLDPAGQRVTLAPFQTDFRSFLGPGGLFGFLARYGGVPTNLSSGGGLQPLALLRAPTTVGEATRRINEAFCNLPYGDVMAALESQHRMALAHRLMHQGNPLPIALRPRLLTEGQLRALTSYGAGVWGDCLTLEQMWLSGTLHGVLRLDPEEAAVARTQPWRGGPASLASDGLFGFGGCVA